MRWQRRCSGDDLACRSVEERIPFWMTAIRGGNRFFGVHAFVARTGITCSLT